MTSSDLTNSRLRAMSSGYSNRRSTDVLSSPENVVSNARVHKYSARIADDWLSAPLIKALCGQPNMDGSWACHPEPSVQCVANSHQPSWQKSQPRVAHLRRNWKERSPSRPRSGEPDRIPFLLRSASFPSVTGPVDPDLDATENSILSAEGHRYGRIIPSFQERYVNAISREKSTSRASQRHLLGWPRAKAMCGAAPLTNGEICWTASCAVAI